MAAPTGVAAKMTGEITRRRFLGSAGSAGMCGALSLNARGVEAAGAASGLVLGENEGEHLIHFRDHGNIYIKAGAANGWDALALGTQQVSKGGGIPVHRHLKMDEAFYVLDGSGEVTLNDAPHPFGKGCTLLIPKNTWHGFSNPEQELLLLWMMAPSGLDQFFRETCSAPGQAPKNLSRDEIQAIALKYGTEFRQPH